MRNLAWFLAAGVSTVVIAACSLANAPDDAVPGPGETVSGSGGGTTGPGGQGGGTTSSTGSSSSSSSASTGGGGTGGSALGETGDPCETAADCEGGFCLTEAEIGFPKGTCSAPCSAVDPEDPDAGPPGRVVCDAGQVCLYANDLTPEGGLCLPICDLGNPMCRPGYRCQPAVPPQIPEPVCFPFCEQNDHCASGKCENNNCQPMELCDDLLDNDFDGLVDCYDLECGCPSACASPVFMDNGSVFSGDTTQAGTANSTRGSCTGPNPGDETNGGTGFTPEVAFYFIPPINGTLHIELTSGPNTDLGLYVRAVCEEKATELTCNDPAGVGGVDVIDLPVGQGSPYFIFVDGYQSLNAGAGPFTLVTYML
jgi:hypothetical protein